VASASMAAAVDRAVWRDVAATQVQAAVESDAAAVTPLSWIASAEMQTFQPVSAAPADDHGSAATQPQQTGIVGVWAPDAGTCSARDFREGTLPTVINAEGAWAGETFCIFTKRKEIDGGWHVVAKCSAPRARWTSNVRLTVVGSRLTWTSERGTQAYTRCAPDVLMAHAK
jgi:hypothetical protein